MADKNTPPPNAPKNAVRIPGTNIWQVPPPTNSQGIAVNHGGKGDWVRVPVKEETRGRR